jgi:hypothetical protein
VALLGKAIFGWPPSKPVAGYFCKRRAAHKTAMLVDRPAGSGDAPSLKITPEMARAGADALAGFNLDFESEEEAAIRVFVAMTETRERTARGKPARGAVA